MFLLNLELGVCNYTLATQFVGYFGWKYRPENVCCARKAELDTKIFYVADEVCRMYHHILTVQESVSQFLFRRRTWIRRPVAASSHGLWWAKRLLFLPSTASHSRRDGIVFVARNSSCEQLSSQVMWDVLLKYSWRILICVQDYSIKVQSGFRINIPFFSKKWQFKSGTIKL